MVVKTIKSYFDKDDGKLYSVNDKDLTREVSEERGKELIKKGVAVKVKAK